ncbi:MAG TPA: hypothetical protein VNV66_10260 [Pilimelia sp.]|nr:hypothetical protein [Pilimelia sp.]
MAHGRRTDGQLLGLAEQSGGRPGVSGGQFGLGEPLRRQGRAGRAAGRQVQADRRGFDVLNYWVDLTAAGKVFWLVDALTADHVVVRTPDECLGDRLDAGW